MSYDQFFLSKDVKIKKIFWVRVEALFPSTSPTPPTTDFTATMLRSTIQSLQRVAKTNLRLTNASRLPSRCMSTEQQQSFWAVRGSVPSLNSEQATACFETVSTYLELSRASDMLKEIRLSASNQSLATRWQRMFDIYLTTQLHCIHPFGYAADQNGLQAFNMNVAQVMTSAGT